MRQTSQVLCDWRPMYRQKVIHGLISEGDAFLKYLTILWRTPCPTPNLMAYQKGNPGVTGRSVSEMNTVCNYYVSYNWTDLIPQDILCHMCLLVCSLKGCRVWIPFPIDIQLKAWIWRPNWGHHCGHFLDGYQLIWDYFNMLIQKVIQFRCYFLSWIHRGLFWWRLGITVYWKADYNGIVQFCVLPVMADISTFRK